MLSLLSIVVHGSVTLLPAVVAVSVIVVVVSPIVVVALLLLLPTVLWSTLILVVRGVTLPRANVVTSRWQNVLGSLWQVVAGSEEVNLQCTWAHSEGVLDSKRVRT